MIEHLRGRDRKLEPLGWTGQDAEWIALVCLHSGVFTRGAGFCDYFGVRRKRRSAIRARHWLSAERRSRASGRYSMAEERRAGYRASRSTGRWEVEDIRHRKKASNPVVMRRLLSLDFVLEHPGMNWLPAEPEKVEFFEKLGLPLRLIPAGFTTVRLATRSATLRSNCPLPWTLKPSPLPTSIRATRRIPNSTRGEPRMGRFGMRSARRGGRFG